jgi:hypothetical protein
MIPAFLYVKWKKNARNNDSGIFMCIIEKKTPELMIPAFLYVNGKKNAKTIVPAFLCV